MDVRLGDEMRLLRSVLARFFAQSWSPETARRAEPPMGAQAEAPVLFDGELWLAFARLGALEAGLPVEAGGAGLGLTAATVVAEEAGRALYQSPLNETLMVADLILSGGGGRRFEPLLAEIAGGRLTATPALRLRGDDRLDYPEETALKGLVEGGGSGRLRVGGTRRFVSLGRVVDYLAIAVRLPDAGPASASVALYLIDRRRAGLEVRRQDDVGRGELASVVLREVAVSEDDLLVRPDETERAYAEALARARVRQAAYLVGLSRQALDLTVKYAKEREQFGRAIGSFQSIAFRLAAMAARIQAARLLAWNLAWRSDRGEDIRRPAAGLAAMTGELAREVTAESLQIHGSFGLTEEAEPQRFYRRAAVEAMLWGTPAELKEEAGRLL